IRHAVLVMPPRRHFSAAAFLLAASLVSTFLLAFIALLFALFLLFSGLLFLRFGRLASCGFLCAWLFSSLRRSGRRFPRAFRLFRLGRRLGGRSGGAAERGGRYGTLAAERILDRRRHGGRLRRRLRRCGLFHHAAAGLVIFAKHGGELFGTDVGLFHRSQALH